MNLYLNVTYEPFDVYPPSPLRSHICLEFKTGIFKENQGREQILL